MQNHSPNQTLRAVLAQRQGKGFSEVEATNILRQLLPQIDYLHQQNQAHCQISLDTIIQNNQQIILTATPTTQTANQINIQQDIYDLSIVIIELLTGKVGSSLRNADGSWNWQDDCFVSDQFTDVINRMIGNSAQGRFNYINEIIAALDLYTDVKPLSSSSVNQAVNGENKNQSANNSIFMDVIEAINNHLKNQSNSNNLQIYQKKLYPLYPDFTFLFRGLRAYKITFILISIAGFILFQSYDNPKKQEEIAQGTIEVINIKIGNYQVANNQFPTDITQAYPSFFALKT
ncbi:MAG: hypothetical protein RLZZ507_3202 [Cyanobacteriota bacterium]|jgi:serine/threonine protein kinase